MWSFCLHSLFREYGRQFVRHVALPHPVKTAKAVLTSSALDFSGNVTAVSIEGSCQRLEDTSSIVGAGFCLKPTDPPCMSGRANHNCHYLERLLHSDASDVPTCCRECAIREIGLMTLRTGAAFYIMTSAQDILFDVFVPALKERRFDSGLFALCRYALRPFAVGMLVSGIRGWLFPFETGDCRDYKTWLLADRGIKHDRTALNEPGQSTIRELLANAAKESQPHIRFERRGNILYPE